MFKCSICDKEFKSLAGLTGHKQFKHSSSGKQLAASSSKQLQATGIMLAGKEASSQLWGWRSDMPMVDVIDTVMAFFFKERGVILKEDGSWDRSR